MLLKVQLNIVMIMIIMTIMMNLMTRTHQRHSADCDEIIINQYDADNECISSNDDVCIDNSSLSIIRCQLWCCHYL